MNVDEDADSTKINAGCAFIISKFEDLPVDQAKRSLTKLIGERPSDTHTLKELKRAMERTGCKISRVNRFAEGIDANKKYIITGKVHPKFEYN